MTKKKKRKKKKKKKRRMRNRVRKKKVRTGWCDSASFLKGEAGGEKIAMHFKE
jgi:predicted alpha-1,6-mannanase (GH76 family)